MFLGKLYSVLTGHLVSSWELWTVPTSKLLRKWEKKMVNIILIPDLPSDEATNPHFSAVFFFGHLTPNGMKRYGQKFCP